MAKKARSYFGPSAGDSLVHRPAVNHLARYAGQEPPSPRVQALFEESDIQNLTIDARDQTIWGLDAHADIHQFASGLFGETLNTFYDTKDSVIHKEAQPIVDEFNARQISLYGRQALSMLEVSIKAIGRELDRPLYVPPLAPEPEPKKGFLARLFGG